MESSRYTVIVVGGGHAGAEAAWAAANMLRPEGGRVALVTMNRRSIGQMSCNPAIGGLAKGQMVCEVDAMGGLMGLAIDATGIQFRLLNRSKGPAVRGPRAQADMDAYAAQVQRLLSTRPNLEILQATVERLLVEGGRCVGVVCRQAEGEGERVLVGSAVVLTTGTFLRGLMHTGLRRRPGGRYGEPPAEGLSRSLQSLGFQLGRLKTGTPPRLDRATVDLSQLSRQAGDDPPQPFSMMTGMRFDTSDVPAGTYDDLLAGPFPRMPQRCCWLTQTHPAIHQIIRANLDRAPMYNGQIHAECGPRYCPSIEDKVVRFADKASHHVFLEPQTVEGGVLYCNGISTSLPADVQEAVVRMLPGCRRARIVRYGYAIEYDMVWPHQIDATTMTKRVSGLFLAGQINGTSGYEEAAAQGLLAGVNAVLYSRGQDLVRHGRDQSYLGVMMDDLVTRTPREPYRMFTSRAEHRLLLRADNAPERLTGWAHALGLVDAARWRVYERRQEQRRAWRAYLESQWQEGMTLWQRMRRPQVSEQDVLGWVVGGGLEPERRLAAALLAEVRYAGFLDRHRKQYEQVLKMEHQPLPTDCDYWRLPGLRNEARQVLERYRPATFGQASRLAGITPADLTVLALAMGRAGGSRRTG